MDGTVESSELVKQVCGYLGIIKINTVGVQKIVLFYNVAVRGLS